MHANSILLLSTAATSMSILFIPLQVLEFGGSRLAAGIIVAVYGLMSLLSFYLFGWVSDSKGRMSLIKAGMLLSALTFLLQITASSFLTLLLVRALCGLSIGIFYSSLIMYGIESKKQLGRYTSFESLGWGLGNLMAGIVAIYSKIFLLSSVFFFVSFFIALRLPQVKSERIEMPLIPHRIIRKNIGVYLPFLMRDVAAFSIWALFPIYLSELGASSFWIGMMIFINTGSQFFIKQFIDGMGYRRLFMGGLLISAISFTAYAFPSSYLQVIPIQLMVAVSWSCLHIGGIGLLTTQNAEKASVVGLFSSARSFAQILGPAIAGILTQYYGFNALMIFAGALSLMAFAIRFVLGRRS